MNVRTEIRAGDACYTVKSGDNLSYIAKRFYGSESAADVNAIYESNRKTIGANPNLIYPGQKLYIPNLV
ncbi:MAG: LysM peptidoglycan-binding domain-containing protein [Anaerolineales bacterium]